MGEGESDKGKRVQAYFGIRGRILRSATRKPSTPLTLKSVSTQAALSLSLPMRTVEHMCQEEKRLAEQWSYSISRLISKLNRSLE